MPRIIPCLDVRRGRVVKGVQFGSLVDSGDPVELAARYAEDGADELVWLDIMATVEATQLRWDQISRARRRINIPLTVGGGIRTIDDVKALLEHGADKVSINSQALADPDLITKVASRWGAQCVVVAIDAKREAEGFYVYSHGGRRRTPWELGAWLKESERRGAGEFLLTSIDRDGGQQGYDLELLEYAREKISRPLIASGGAGTVADLIEAIRAGHQAVLLASILHQGQTRITTIKQQLQEAGVTVRWPVS